MMEENSNQPFNSEEVLDIIRKNPAMQVAVFGVLWLFCGLIGSFLAQSVGYVAGIRDLKDLMAGMKQGEYLEHINTLKILNIISHVFVYTIPVFIFVVLVHPKDKFEVLYLKKSPQIKNILLGFVMVMVVFPFISFLYYWNTQLIPTESISQETLDLQKLFLDMKTPTDFILNLVMVGVVAGIGEELFFRGIIQRFLTKWTKNVHIGALFTGLAFSFMHYQPEGFVPRLVLGILFCYFLIITGNLWISILVHVFFNSIQVIIPYFSPNLIGNINEIEEVPMLFASISLVGFLIILTIFRKVNPENNYIEIN